MNNEEKIFREFKDRMFNYSEQPKQELWQNINDKLHSDKTKYICLAAVTGSLIIVAGVAALVLAPAVNKTENSVVKTAANTANAADNSLQALTDNTVSIIDEEKTLQQTPKTDIKENINYKEESSVAESTAENVKPSEQNLTSVQQTEVLPAAKEENTSVKQPGVNPKSNTVPAKAGSTGQVSDVVMAKLVLPNAFQPSSPDERINTFKPAYRDVASYEMKIFSRNGKCLFTTTDITKGWDGRINSGNAEAGVYIYMYKCTDADGKNLSDQGTFMLMR